MNAMLARERKSSIGPSHADDLHLAIIDNDDQSSGWM